VSQLQHLVSSIAEQQPTAPPHPRSTAGCSTAVLTCKQVQPYVQARLTCCPCTSGAPCAHTSPLPHHWCPAGTAAQLHSIIMTAFPLNPHKNALPMPNRRSNGGQQTAVLKKAPTCSQSGHTGMLVVLTCCPCMSGAPCVRISPLPHHWCPAGTAASSSATSSSQHMQQKCTETTNRVAH
jgi:hypothetical protein